MDKDNALKIAGQIAAQKVRWGRHYNITSDYSDETVAKVIMALSQAEAAGPEMVPKDQLSAANRRAGAAEAREKNLRQRIEALTKDLKRCQQRLYELDPSYSE